MNKKQFISASEIGEYVYCQRAWWLRVNGNGKQTIAMLVGQVKHNSLGDLLQAFKRNTYIAWALLFFGIGLLLLLASFLISQ